MTTEERFKAAASVIRNLPKNGAYQPSDELMLRFYSYYKQATKGPCKSSPPAFWQFVKKARWQAWAKLGDMSQEEAMNRYIDELESIVETMSFNKDVANFLDTVDLFCESLREQAQFQSDSSLSDASAETFQCRDKENVDNNFISSYETCQESFNGNDSYAPETEADDEFIDSVDYTLDSLQREFLRNHIKDHQSEFQHLNDKTNTDFERTSDDVNFVQCNDTKTIMNHDINKNTEYNAEQLNLEFMNQVMITLKDLQNNLDQVVNRIGNIEEKMQYTKKMRVNATYDKSVVKS